MAKHGIKMKFTTQDEVKKKYQGYADNLSKHVTADDVAQAAATPRERQERKLGGRDNTAFHFDAGKPMVDQLPPEALLEVAKVFTYGASKYGHWNWQEHAEEWGWNQLYASCLRHMLAWQMGEDLDPESGLPHLAHAICNLMMLVTLIQHEKGSDDRGPLAIDREEVEPLTFAPYAPIVKDYWDKVIAEMEEVAAGKTWFQMLKEQQLDAAQQAEEEMGVQPAEPINWYRNNMEPNNLSVDDPVGGNDRENDIPEEFERQRIPAYRDPTRGVEITKDPETVESLWAMFGWSDDE